MILSMGKVEQKELLDKLGVENSSNVLEYIEELVDSRFIERHYTWDIKRDKTSKLSQYRLSDNYIRFYLKYIYPNSQKVSDQIFNFKSLYGFPGWPSIIALQVENLVINNRNEIIHKMNISAEDVVQAGPYFQRATKRSAGCQIDLLIQTRVNVLYVCEIKFSKNPLHEGVAEEVQKKVDALLLPKGFSVCPVLIHASEIHDKLLDKNYFTHIIDLADLTGNGADY